MNHLFRSRGLLALLLLVAFTHAPGCASNHGHLHARGALAERAWVARVDHPVARDYLEGRPLPMELEEIRRAYLPDGALASKEALSHLTSRYSTDVATLFFAETASAHSPSRSIQKHLEKCERAVLLDRVAATKSPLALR